MSKTTSPTLDEQGLQLLNSKLRGGLWSAVNVVIKDRKNRQGLYTVLTQGKTVSVIHLAGISLSAEKEVQLKTGASYAKSGSVGECVWVVSNLTREILLQRILAGNSIWNSYC